MLGKIFNRIDRLPEMWFIMFALAFALTDNSEPSTNWILMGIYFVLIAIWRRLEK